MRKRWWTALGAALLIAACGGGTVVSLPRASAPHAARLPGPGRFIKHIVVIVQENRSFENVFAGWPGADAPMMGTTSTGARVRLKSLRYQQFSDLGHFWENAMLEWHGGKMDRFDLDGYGSTGNGAAVGLYPYSYIDRTEIGPYRQLARQYVLADRFFPTEFGTSFTSHQDLIAGTAQVDPQHSLVNIPTDVPWGWTHQHEGGACRYQPPHYA